MAQHWLFLQDYDNPPKKRNRTSFHSHKKQITDGKRKALLSNKTQLKKYVWLSQGKFQA